MRDTIMRYILPTDALDKLRLLRQQYQQDKNINIDDIPSMFGIPTMFGGTDVVLRKKQIVFLEKLIAVLRPNLKKLEETTSLEEHQASVTAWKVLLTACLFVESQNNKKASLSSIINHDLSINAENYPDTEDKENCFATANRFISTKNALEDANAALVKAKLGTFSEKDWSEFTEYLENNKVNKVPPNPFADYPITSITQPLFRATFTYTGATIGLLSGDVISKSTKAMSAKYQLTALIGGSLLLFGPAGPTGVALFAPVIASKLITAFCSITLAHVLGIAMGAVGHGVGSAVGYPLDWTFQLLWKVCTLISGYYFPEPQLPSITGIRISDGALINGIALNITPVEEIEKMNKQHIIELKEDGSMHVNGKAIITAQDGVHLAPSVIEELKVHLKTYLPQQADQETESKTNLQGQTLEVKEELLQNQGAISCSM